MLFTQRNSKFHSTFRMMYNVSYVLLLIWWFHLHWHAVEALRTIKESLIDINGNLSSWNRGDPCTSKWTGVMCSNTTLADGFLHVQQLYVNMYKFKILFYESHVNMYWFPFSWSILYLLFHSDSCLLKFKNRFTVVVVSPKFLNYKWLD